MLYGYGLGITQAKAFAAAGDEETSNEDEDDEYVSPSRRDLGQAFRQRLEVLPAARVELLRMLMLPGLQRAERIGEFRSYPQSRPFAELLIDCEEDRNVRAVLVGMLREAERPTPPGRSPCPYPDRAGSPELGHPLSSGTLASASPAPIRSRSGTHAGRP